MRVATMSHEAAVQTSGSSMTAVPTRVHTAARAISVS